MKDRNTSLERSSSFDAGKVYSPENFIRRLRIPRLKIESPWAPIWVPAVLLGLIAPFYIVATEGWGWFMVVFYGPWLCVILSVAVFAGLNFTTRVYCQDPWIDRLAKCFVAAVGAYLAGFVMAFVSMFLALGLMVILAPVSLNSDSG